MSNQFLSKHSANTTFGSHGASSRRPEKQCDPSALTTILRTTANFFVFDWHQYCNFYVLNWNQMKSFQWNRPVVHVHIHHGFVSFQMLYRHFRRLRSACQFPYHYLALHSFVETSPITTKALTWKIVDDNATCTRKPVETVKTDEIFYHQKSKQRSSWQ